jgi:hypothetical protein
MQHNLKEFTRELSTYMLLITRKNFFVEGKFQVLGLPLSVKKTLRLFMFPKLLTQTGAMQRKLSAMLIFLMCLTFQSQAQGDLLITPKRVVFEGNKLRETLNLANMGKDTATYSISFIQYDMKEDGSFVTVEKSGSGQMFADPYLRVFPRRVTLAPGEPQVIMLQYRRVANMPAGEYRSHLYFRAEKNIGPLTFKSSGDSTQLSVQLIPIYGLSIPIIIRSGIVNVSSSLSDLKLDTQQGSLQYLMLTINRTGNISVYGNILIEYSPVQGKPYEIGEINGVGVYTNIEKRKIAIKLNNSSGQPLTNGKLKVKFVSNEETKRVIYAEGELVLK